MSRALLLIAVLTSSAGCRILAPVVDQTASVPGPAGDDACSADIRCDLLDVPPPETLAASDLEPPSPRCTREPRAMTITDDVVLDAGGLDCIALDLAITPSSRRDEATPLTVRIEGNRDSLVAFALHASSTTDLVRVDLAVGHMEDAEIRLEGAVRMTLLDTNVDRARFELGGRDPIEAPELLIDRGTLDEVEIIGTRAPVRFRDAAADHAVITARSVAFERGLARHAILTGELVELLDANALWTRFEADRVIVTGGQVDDSWVARCGSLTLAATHVMRSRFAACASAVDVQTASIGDSTFEGDVAGVGTTFVRSVLASDAIDVARGTLSDVALCGTSRVAVQSASCVRCEPAAPGEVCVSHFAQIDACPGFCEATCGTGAAPAQLDAEECAP